MNSLRTYSGTLHQSSRKCTCFKCKETIPVGRWHFRIFGSMDRLVLKLCKQCIRKLNTDIMWEDNE